MPATRRTYTPSRQRERHHDGSWSRAQQGTPTPRTLSYTTLLTPEHTHHGANSKEDPRYHIPSTTSFELRLRGTVPGPQSIPPTQSPPPAPSLASLASLATSPRPRRKALAAHPSRTQSPSQPSPFLFPAHGVEDPERLSPTHPAPLDRRRGFGTGGLSRHGCPGSETLRWRAKGERGEMSVRRGQDGV